jgi:hypothetical protein
MRITPLMTSAPVISDYMHSIIKEWHGFSWNFVRTLCQCRLLQTHTFSFPTAGSSNVTDAQSREVGGWSRHGASSVHAHYTSDDVITRDIRLLHLITE